MKIKIDLNKPFLKLNGEPNDIRDKEGKLLTPSPLLCVDLAGLLSGFSKNIKVLKAFNWATTLDKKEPIEIDEHDYNELHTFVENHENATVAFKAQILNIMSAAKEAVAKK